MAYFTEAKIDRPDNTDKYRVMFTSMHRVLVSTADEAAAIKRMVDHAYERGKSDIQSELRDLLNVEARSDG